MCSLYCGWKFIRSEGGCIHWWKRECDFRSDTSMRSVKPVFIELFRIKAKVQHYTFDQISKNNTGVLDALYNAEILVIDISGWVCL